MEGGIRGTGGSGYEDEYRGSSQGGGYGGGSSSGWQDETRFGSSRGGREGRQAECGADWSAVTTSFVTSLPPPRFVARDEMV